MSILPGQLPRFQRARRRPVVLHGGEDNHWGPAERDLPYTLNYVEALLIAEVQAHLCRFLLQALQAASVHNLKLELVV